MPSSRPLATTNFLLIPPSAFALCVACGLILNAGALNVRAEDSTGRVVSTPLPSTPLATIITHPVFTIHATNKKSAASKNTAVLKAAAPPIKKATTIKTSAASRVSARRAGSLQAIAPQKAPSRFALTSLQSNSSQHDFITQIVAPDAHDDEGNLIATQPATVPVSSSPILATTSMSTASSAASDGDDDDSNADDSANDDEAPVPLTATIQVPLSSAMPPSASDESVTPVTATITTPETKNGKKVAADKVDQPGKLYAPRITYDRGNIIAEGDADDPVRLESNDTKITAQKVVVDTTAKTVKAEGRVRVERQVVAKRFQALHPPNIATSEYRKETITETLQGDNFEYNFGTKQGNLDNTAVRLSTFNISAEHLTINGQLYIARNVIIRPGGLSDEELKIYGTPPFNIRARQAIIDKSKPAPSNDVVGDTVKSDEPAAPTGVRTEVKGAALYFRNLRLFPIPSALLRRQGGPREQSTYQLTPRIFFNSADGVMVTAQLQYPLTPAQPGRLDLEADVGLSSKVGFRGGLELHSSTGIGRLSIGARINDVISSQLTDRIELDRLPEIQYSPPPLKLFNLPGSRAAGFRFGFSAGNYRENFTSENRSVEDSRLQAQVRFTTRLAKNEGPYLDLFARGARYGDFNDNLSTLGFEVGYIGRIGSRLNGQLSFSAQDVNGATPFRFDRVEIKKELRATFDILLTPRYIIPLDLRYDVDTHTLRDKTFGILRNYKTFAYGVVYQSSRHELRLEIRQGF